MLLFITHAGMTAALYTVLTLTIAAFGLANGAIQIRISEALTVLPYFTPAAVPGLFVGCVLSNILIGAPIWDVIFGSLATLIGAVGTYFLGKYVNKWLSSVPPILANTLIIPFVLKYAYGAEDALPFLMLTVGIGEIIILRCARQSAARSAGADKKTYLHEQKISPRTVTRCWYMP